MNSLIKLLTKFGLLKDDLDYHVVGASMVIIFLFFGYQKWFEYEARTLIPFISNGPLISWMYPVFGVRGLAGFWGHRMVDLRAPVLGVLEQKGRNSGRPRFSRFIPHDRHYYPIYAEWMGGISGRFSRHDGQRAVPDEGCGALCGIVLSAEAGCPASVADRPAEMIQRDTRARGDRPRVWRQTFSKPRPLARCGSPRSRARI